MQYNIARYSLALFFVRTTPSLRGEEHEHDADGSVVPLLSSKDPGGGSPRASLPPVALLLPSKRGTVLSAVVKQARDALSTVFFYEL